jgi:hypothetical protein
MNKGKHWHWHWPLIVGVFVVAYLFVARSAAVEWVALAG